MEHAIKGSDEVSGRALTLLFRVGLAIIASALIVALPCEAEQLANHHLSLKVNTQDGSYQLAAHRGQPVLNSRVGVQVDHKWLRSSDYPRHQALESTFNDVLGPGRQLTVTCSELEGKPDLIYVL